MQEFLILSIISQLSTVSDIHGSIIHNHKQKWKQPKCPQSDAWVNRMWYIHTVEYYLTEKWNEILIHATTWEGLKNIMLSDRSHISYDSVYIKCSEQVNPYRQGFPGGTVVKNPPANEGDMGSSPSPGRSHMPWSN